MNEPIVRTTLPAASDEIRTESKKRFELTSSQLKLIALVSMVIDHIGRVLCQPWLMEHTADAGTAYEAVTRLNDFLRTLGRLAYPLFIFLMIEGFVYTRDRKKYALRLACFAVIAEIPFDLAMSDTWWYMGYQNVLITLLFGFIGMYLIEVLREHVHERWLYTLGLLAVMGGLAYLGYVSDCDYGEFGVLAMLCGYLQRFSAGKLYKKHPYEVEMAIIAFILFLGNFTETLAFLAIIPVHYYNGEKGTSRFGKYFFYLFYPAHLLVLYGIRLLLY